jgi:hypothetical protein
VQGFYFGRPMPVNQVAAAIRRDMERHDHGEAEPLALAG